MKIVIKNMTACSLFLCLTALPPAFAKEFRIGQKDKQFRQNGEKIEELTVNVGDTVVFINDDNTAHNVFSKSENSKFNLKIQKPNSETPHKFDKAGEVIVRCAIHPKMKLKVTVTNDGPGAVTKTAP